MNSWLVTGAAGYIGSQVSRHLLQSGYNVIALDNLSHGHVTNLPKEIQFLECDVRNYAGLRQALSGVLGVVHLAGYKFASLSETYPEQAFSNNVEGTETLIKAMVDSQCQNLIFSSSCAIYGSPSNLPVTEDHPKDPLSPYALSKWIAEQAIESSELNFVNLRFFNVVGSGPDLIEDHSDFNLFPIILNSWEQDKVAQIRGRDYETPDGTAVRDYIHVTDIAEAHLRSIELLLRSKVLRKSYNLAGGNGFSVLQVMKEFKEVLGESFNFEYGDRRSGDPASIYGSSMLAELELGWEVKKTLRDMVESSVAARKKRLNF